MPHFIIEYSEMIATEVQIPALLDAVHAAALSSELFPESHIKTRVIPVKFYRVGGGGHSQLRMKFGRSDAQKRALSHSVLAAIKNQRWPADVVTVEVVDMDVASYAKYIL